MGALDGIRGVTLDLMGTLLDVEPSVGGVYAEVLRDYGGDAAPEEIELHFGQAFKTVTNGPRGAVLTQDDWRAIVEKTFAGISYDRARQPSLFEALWATFAEARRWRVLPGTAELLERLKGRGLRLAVLSNNDARMSGVLEAHGLNGYFTTQVLSAELGVAKPDETIFREAERRLDLPAKAMLHVGDRRDEDVAGALAASWRAVYIGDGDCPPGVLRVKDLRELATLF